MKFDIITTQESIFKSFFKTGLIARGLEKKIIDIKVTNLYDFGIGVHKSIDDTPSGGGAGMVLRVDVMDKALKKIKSSKCKIILLTPQGKRFNQKIAKRLAKDKNLILISGRFEGYDERIRDLVDEEISIGDFILTSGDLPAMVLIDTISRQLPGFIDREESIKHESFENDLIEYPQYTRPAQYNSKKIPKILVSGNHTEIAKWRKDQAVKRTKKHHIDLTSK